ncbi:MAG: alpha-ketoacid dehydrogenase subunit beta [Bdellovibrionales bacterium]|nr:alpha-ketoacid dehydrogenase subunit beta [Bdellovibrionales bacterium]
MPANSDASTSLTTYIDAIRQALEEEMERDESIICIGEDIGGFGGAFKATKGLLQRYGEERVIDFPIAETALIAMATGAAMYGLRPVVEIQFADFVTNGFNQIVTNAARVHYRYGQSVPLVIRLPSGGGLGAGPFHSINPEAWFFHCPGLKLVAPATANDARGLLKAAIRDNNPVLFFEHKYLYRRVKETLEPGDGACEIGHAAIRRAGSDLTIVTYGVTLGMCLEAADVVAQDGIDVEIIDLRTLLPWDRQLVLGSVRKTARALVVHEATRTGGIGAEIAATIGEAAFQHLLVRRLCSHDTPVPFAPTLEEFFRPSTAKVVDEIRALATY